MNLYPAIDLFQGQVVRLTQGDFNTCTIYSNNPAEMASIWQGQGAQWIHVVDLEGAKTGQMSNEKSLAAICKRVKSKIQFGGGLRTLADIQKVFDLGVTRVVLGTKALDPVFLKQIVRSYGSGIAVGFDVRHDSVKTDGWAEDGNISLAQALVLADQFDVQTIIYTDIEKDGVLQGPNWQKLQLVLEKTKASVILSGGISQLSDIEYLRSISAKNFAGAIIGKALYEKRFTLVEAFNQLNRKKE
ncbi:MAG TPA: 1-(5-phosphoribosyl)-5-[(5-phosphoribosylamino)methylideneamino]imidazole-4-carboxamide isomerase [Candidatus Omnitrophota bacterium]|nr:1-(5-phosphoribosyl)-5-[(5-phosphoribosylamino)methylideneamino]imidazole-4-carboxamide isomerase [Candidatus Omnitrophota bacterium]